MKIFTKSETQALEHAAEARGLSLSKMMENAGEALAAEPARQGLSPEGRSVVLICGKGNNGGDGFVCAKSLSRLGARCTLVLTHGEPDTELSKAAFEKLPENVRILRANTNLALIEQAIAGADIIFDCVYGFGFRGELDQNTAELFRLCHTFGALRISADLPSGCECDTGRAAEGCFRAHITLSFTCLKPAHVSYPAKEFCGETLVRGVGIDRAVTHEARASFSLTSSSLVQDQLPSPPDVQANKGSMGRLLLVCGSYGMAGACIMAARAALRCGVGLLNVACPRQLYPVLASALPEAVFTVYRPLKAEEALRDAIKLCSAWAIGCGLGTELSDLVCPVFFRLAGEHPRPGLIDADGLNFLSRNPEALSPLSIAPVITPHPGEAARLLCTSVGQVQAGRIQAAQALCRRFGTVSLLKGAATVICAPGSGAETAINPTGNPGMAKGGSGDVLSGIIGAFLAQGLKAFWAAVCGAYIHGMAGDLGREQLSARALLPTDMIEILPQISKKLERLP